MSFGICKAALLVTLISLCGCTGLPARPHFPLFQILVESDSKGNVKVAKVYGYYFDDYDEDGNLKPGAKKVEVPISSLKDLRGGLFIHKNHIEPFKVWMGEVREYAKANCEK